MSDRPATDAEVAALAKSIAILKPEHEIDLNVGFVLSLIARIEADGERMRKMEKALKRWQSVAREATRAVCHYCEDECVDESLCDECSLSIQPTLDELDRLLDREGHPLTPEALAELEAPDA